MMIDLRCPMVAGAGETERREEMEETNGRKTGLDALASLVEASEGPAGDQLGARAVCEAMGWGYDSMMGAKSLAEALGHVLDEAESEGERLGLELSARGEAYDNYDVAALRTIQRKMSQTAELYPSNPIDVVSVVGGDRGIAVGRALCDVIAEAVRAAKSKRDAAEARLLAPSVAPSGAREEATNPTPAPAEQPGREPTDTVVETATAAESAGAPMPVDADGKALAIGDEIVVNGCRSKVELVGLNRVAYYDRGTLRVAEGTEVRKVVPDTEPVVEADARLTVADYAARRGVEASEYAVRRDLMDRWAALRGSSASA